MVPFLTDLDTPWRGPRQFELRRREPVLGDPERQRALLEERRRVRRLRDRAHARGERDREHSESDQYLD